MKAVETSNLVEHTALDKIKGNKGQGHWERKYENCFLLISSSKVDLFMSKWSSAHSTQSCNTLDWRKCFYRAMHFSAKRGIAIACRLSVCLSVCDVGELW